MKIHKGDQVLIISGKDRGRKSKVLEAFPKESRVVVEGINLRKKHMKPKKSGEKGQIIEIPAPLSVSNVKLICSKCGKAARVGYEKSKRNKFLASESKKEQVPRKQKQKSKIRICKKCGQAL